MKQPKHNLLKKGALAVMSGFLITGAIEEAQAQIDEIVVSAQKREERALDVPISLSAYGGDQLSRQGIFEVEQLASFVPSLTFDDQLIAAGARVRIRGIGGPTFTSGVETSVSVVQDGIVTGPTGSGLADLFDVERIEVLRGPQGTLFGKNATAGVLNIVSKAPTDEFEAFGTFRFTQGDFDPVGNDYRRYRFEAGLSGPITDNLRARLSGFFLDDANGFIEDVVLDDTQNRLEHWGIRGRTDYENENFRSDLLVQYVQTNDRCCAPTFVRIDPSATGLGLNPALQASLSSKGIPLAEDNRQAINSDRIGEEQKVLHMAWDNSWTFNSGHVLKSITGYRNWISFGEDDSDKSDVLLVDATQAEINLRLITQEFQLLSPSNERFEYVVGFYSYFQRLSDRFIVGFAGNPSDAHSLVNIKNLAVFGNATYDITEQFEAFGGVRFLYEDLEIVGGRGGAFFGGQPGNNIAFRRETEEDVDWTGRFGLRFLPTPDNSIYVSYSRGYKGHGLNNSNSGPFFTSTNTANPILDPETVNAIEIGTKNSFFDGRLIANAVFFYNRFKDFQTSSFDGASNTFSLRNAGKIDLMGIEIDFTAEPWEGGFLYLGGAWIDGEFEEFTGAPCTALQNATGACPVGGQDLSGRKIDGTPEFQLSIIARQDFPIANDVFGYVSTEFSWQDDRQFNADLDPLLVQEAYSVTNFRAGVLPTENTELTFFVENAFDKVYATNLRPAPVFAGVVGGFVAPGRTFGVELRANF